MKVYQVKHRCKSYLIDVTDSYAGGALAFCKKCGVAISVPPVSNNKDFKYILKEPEQEPEPTHANECFESQSHSQSQSFQTG